MLKSKIKNLESRSQIDLNDKFKSVFKILNASLDQFMEWKHV